MSADNPLTKALRVDKRSPASRRPFVEMASTNVFAGQGHKGGFCRHPVGAYVDKVLAGQTLLSNFCQHFAPKEAS